MDHVTAKELVMAIMGSGGIIGGLVSLLVFIAGRLDRKRDRDQEELETSIHSSAEFKRIKLEEKSSVEQSLWRMMEAKDAEIKALREEIAELERTQTLTRPVINNIITIIRAMRKELDSIKVIMLSDEETKYFQARWIALGDKLNELENLIP